MGTPSWMMEPEHGVQSQLYADEFEQMLIRHKQLMAELGQRTTLGQAVSRQSPDLTPEQAQPIADAIISGRNRQQSLIEMSGMRARDINELKGRAEHYGINIENMAPDDIWAAIKARRSGRFWESVETGPEPGSPELYREILGEAAAALGIGTADGIMRLLHNLPFAGDHIAKAEGIQKFDQWMFELDEAVSGAYSDSERLGWDVAQGLAMVGVYWHPGNVAWKVAGGLTGAARTGMMAGRINPLVKTALPSAGQMFKQGALATAFLEAGGDAPWEERAMIIGAGGLLPAGAVAGYRGIMAAAERVRRSYRGRLGSPQGLLPRQRGIDTDYVPVDATDPMYPGGGGDDGLPTGRDVSNMAGLPPFIPRRGDPIVTPAPSFTQGPITTPPAGGSASRALPPAVAQAASEPGASMFTVTRPTDVDPIFASLVGGAENVATGPQTVIVSRNTIPGQQPWRVTRFNEDGVPVIHNDVPTREAGEQLAKELGGIPSQPEVSPMAPQVALIGRAGTVDNAAPDPITVYRGGYQQGLGNTSWATTERQIAELYADADPGRRLWSMDLTPEEAARLGYGEYGGSGDVPLPPEMAARLKPVLSAGEAVVEASTLTKHATILEAPNLNMAARKPEYDDLDLIRAAIASAPGEVSVIRNVGSGSRKQMLKKLGEQVGPDELLDKTRFRLVERGDGYDILVSQGQKLTNQHVTQHKKYGMFYGQRALTVEGQEMIIKAIKPDGMAMVVPAHKQNGHSYLYPVADLFPKRASLNGAEIGTPDAPQIYQQFRQFAMDYMATEADKAGIPMRGWIDKETSSQLPRLMEDFFRRTGIDSGPESQLTVKMYESYFAMQRLRDFENAASPEVAQLTSKVMKQTARDMSEAVEAGRMQGSLADAAEAAGYRLEHNGGRGWDLVDDASGMVVPVDSDLAASQFLKGFAREAPDVMPPGNIPDELFDVVPGASHPGNSKPPVLSQFADEAGMQQGMEDLADMADELEEMQALVAEELPFGGGAGGAGGAGGGGGGRPPFVPDDFGEGPERVGPGLAKVREMFRNAGKSYPGIFEAANELFDSTWLKMSPMRNAFGALDDALGEMGMSGTRLFPQYNSISVGYTNMNNAMRPWLHELGDITTSMTDRLFVRGGSLLEILETGEESVRVAMMQQAGYKGADIEAFYKFENLITRLLKSSSGDLAQPGDARNFMTYMRHLRKHQLAGAENSFDLASEYLPPHLAHLGDEFRYTNFDVREFNADRMAARLIRSVHFRQHIRPHWEVMKQTWDQDGIPEQLRGFVVGWLDIVRKGRDTREDLVIGGVRSLLNRMGVPATRRDVSSMFGGITGSIYRSYLGFRVDALLREGLQPFMAGVKIGHGNVVKTYGRYLAGGEAKTEMLQRAIRNGWVEPGRPRLALADEFADAPLSSEGLEAFPPGRYRELMGSREKYQKAVDSIWNMMPVRARRGIQDTGLDPLLWYGKTTTAGKVVAGNAAYEKALVDIAEFQAGRVDLDGLQDLLATSYYSRAFQDELAGLLKAGSFDAAATRYATEVVADSMMRVGSHEQPMLLQKSGAIGRFGMMFGNFSLGTLHWFNGIKQAAPRQAIDAAGRYGAMIGALAGAEALTGFKFSRWAWHQSLGFFGGPIVEPAITAYTAAKGATTETFTDFNASWQEQAAMREVTIPNVLGGTADMLNPFRGLVRTAQGIEAGLNTPNPAYYTSRFMVTGERGDRRERQDFMENWTPAAGVGGFAPPPNPNTPPFLNGGGTAGPAPVAMDGVTDPSRLRQSPNGHMVYDTPNRTADGKVPTHRLDVPSGRAAGETWEQYEERVNATPLEAFPDSVRNVISDPAQLDVEVATPLMEMIREAAANGIDLRINETYRDPKRQEFLFKQGRSTRGAPVTWTLTSDHATRRAADLRAPNQQGYEWIQANAPRFGFTVLGMDDPGHVAIPLPSNSQDTPPFIGAGATSQSGPIGAGAMQ